MMILNLNHYYYKENNKNLLNDYIINNNDLDLISSSDFIIKDFNHF